jgi:hypothetical protein
VRILRAQNPSFGFVIDVLNIWLMALAGNYTRCVAKGSIEVFAPTEDRAVYQKKCARKHPPGRKVYQRGAHTIWEVDGAKEKVSMVYMCMGVVPTLRPDSITALLSESLTFREIIY